MKRRIWLVAAILEYGWELLKWKAINVWRRRGRK